MTEETGLQNWLETFYKDLQELADSSFPKICTKCGKTYRTKQDFLNETIPVHNIEMEDGSGLFALEGGGQETVVGVFRNCKCGTTLMADFQDRRDNSRGGQDRRKKFNELIDVLTSHGLEYNEARTEILKILHGEHSLAIEKILGDISLT